MSSDPLFSIIIPLDDHRDQWRQSWLGWKSQTVDPSLYEIILVLPRDPVLRADIEALVGDEVRLEYGEVHHDIELSALGASKARGSHLLFTESHCRPESDVLELCIRAIDAHPDWSGFSCRSIPLCHNALSVAEAAMYQSDIEFGMKQHPWLKVLDQCFVTRRDVYEACGGLRTDLGHFAEWVLSAAYFARGHVIGYLEEARFHHYYIGQLDELKDFTFDFVQGEIRYLGEARDDPGRELIEIPLEWSSRGDFNMMLARNAFDARIRSAHQTGSLSGIWRWGVVALAGDRLARRSAAISAACTRWVLTVLTMVGSRDGIARWLKRYIAALIHFQRLECIHHGNEVAGGRLSGFGHQVVTQAGFHAGEVWKGQSFRWSEPEAALQLELPQGHSTIRIASPRIRGGLDRIGVRFYLDGVRITAVAIDAEAYVLQLDRPSSGAAILAWTCRRLMSWRDKRRLGLPVADITVSAGDGANLAPSPAAMVVN